MGRHDAFACDQISESLSLPSDRCNPIGDAPLTDLAAAERYSNICIYSTYHNTPTVVNNFVYYLLRKSELKLVPGEKWKFCAADVINALKLGIPVGIENGVMTAAMVATTRIIAPLGNVALAANIFAIEAEGLCYMPGYGICKKMFKIRNYSRCHGNGTLWNSNVFHLSCNFYDIYPRSCCKRTWCKNSSN